jgi:nucleotide-binding universal stress UspA family protein
MAVPCVCLNNLADAASQETASLAQRLRRQCDESTPLFHRMKDFMKRKTAKPTKAAKSAAASAPLPLRIKSILVPLDFSPPSKKALEYAVTFARQFKAKLTLLHVVEPVAMPDFAASFPLAMENDKLMAAAKSELEGAVKVARGPRGIVEKTLVRFGRSFHEITDAARARKVDLIIISTHGYTGLKHALLGSTTERVVRHAPCPVLVVRQR